MNQLLLKDPERGSICLKCADELIIGGDGWQKRISRSTIIVTKAYVPLTAYTCLHRCNMNEGRFLFKLDPL